MYRAFKLDPIEWPQEFVNYGEGLFEATSKVARTDLSEFISEGSIDGSSLRDHWFEDTGADVFISHSHSDRDAAFGLAGFLGDVFGLKPFIDSGVWGHSTQLQRELDDHHCYNPERRVYDYHSRNVTTSHVHMMLATALSRVMDSAECVIFVSTPNSVSHSDGGDANVSSPWIFYELSQIAMLRRRRPKGRILKEAAAKNFSRKSADIKIRYKADFAGLDALSGECLIRWAERWNGGKSIYESPLAMLYDIKDGQLMGS